MTKCCGRDMVQVATHTEWCGNCGTIRQSEPGALYYGSTAPNLHVCATCAFRSVGEAKGVTRRCMAYDGRGVMYTSPGVWCKKWQAMEEV
jgi:hypothetical protein